MCRKILTLALMSVLTVAAFAQQRSAKRGIGWDEKTVGLNVAHLEQMQPGVTWAYNWGPDPGNADIYSAASMQFVPMCWNGNFDESRIRAFVATHPETRYLLGFNEPNFSAQSNMTPAAAAAVWPRVERLASDLGLMLVGPALNFSNENVGGRVWQPYEWLDEFVRAYPDARMDCLALHCYMNWSSSTIWFATEYFYKDLYDPQKKDVYGHYPNLVAWLDSYKKAHAGEFPRMMLTEFCAWENDGAITGPDFQLDQMTQKLQALEQSDLVEGYAWFMANGNASQYPYYSIFQTNSATAALSELGEVYVHMSAFDETKSYGVGETVFAKDYIDASGDRQLVRPRRNSDTGSEAPLQVELTASAWTKYQVTVPESGFYKVKLHVSSENDNRLMFYFDGKRMQTETIASTSCTWADRDFTVSLESGDHSVMFYNSSSTPILMNEWSFGSESGIAEAGVEENAGREEVIYDLCGLPMTGDPQHGVYLRRCGSEVKKVVY